MQGETLATFPPAGEGEGFQVEWRPLLPPYVWGKLWPIFLEARGAPVDGVGGMSSSTGLHSTLLGSGRDYITPPGFSIVIKGKLWPKFFQKVWGEKTCEEMQGRALINSTSV